MDNTAKRHTNKLDEFKEVIYKTDNKLDIFDEINDKLAKLNADRIILQDAMNFEVGNLRKRMDDIDERSDQTVA